MMYLDASLYILAGSVTKRVIYGLNSLCMHTRRWLKRQAQALFTPAMDSFQRTQPLQICVRKLA